MDFGGLGIQEFWQQSGPSSVGPVLVGGQAMDIREDACTGPSAWIATPG